MASGLKAVFGLILLSGLVVAGAYQLPPMIMLAFIPIFMLAKITEKAGTITVLVSGLLGRNEHITPRQSLLVIVGHALSQSIVVGIFFAIAYGVSSMVNDTPPEPISAYIPIGMTALGVLAAIVIARGGRRSALDEEDKEMFALMDRLVAMGEQNVIMPVEIFKLARELAEYPDQHAIAIYLQEGFDTVQHHFQQRVFFTYLRFSAEGGASPIKEPAGYIVEALYNEHRWVGYDAVWAYMALGIQDDEVDELLDKIAEDFPLDTLDDDPEIDEPHRNFYQKVHEAIDRRNEP